MKINIWLVVALVIGAGYFVFNRGVEKDPMRFEAYDESDAASSTPPNGPPSGNLKRFYDATGQYRIDYPSDWTLDDHSRSGKMIRADIHKGNDVGIQIRILDQTDTSFASFVDSYRRRFIKDMTGHWKGTVTEFSRQFDWIGAHEGCRIRMMMVRGDGQQWLFKQYLWPTENGNNRVVVLQCGTLAKDQWINEPILDAVADSFLFSYP